jgi:hypothetical protein
MDGCWNHNITIFGIDHPVAIHCKNRRTYKAMNGLCK